MKAYFTRDEAEACLKSSVEAVVDLPSVPSGTRGSVNSVRKHGRDQWVVKIQWDLPKTASQFDMIILDLHLNFYRRDKSVVTEFSKSEFEKSVKELLVA